MSSLDLSPTDGRVLRRADNREAALRSGIDLFARNKVAPTIEEVAAESGISIRSLYRYFGDASVMIVEATQLLVEETRPLATFSPMGEGPLADRIATLVGAHFRAYQHVRPALRATILNIAAQAELAPAQHAARELLRLQFSIHFAPELQQSDDAAREHILQAGSAVCNLEFIDMLVERQEMPMDTAQAIVIRLLTNVLAPAPS